jgi:hypothetical protein
MMTLKISLALFFLRIMVQTWQRRIVIGAVTLSTIFSIAYFFFVIFQCGAPTSPIGFVIKKLSGKGCVNPNTILAISYAHAAIQTITDLIFAMLPIAILRGSNMTKREKVTVFFILALGAL